MNQEATPKYVCHKTVRALKINRVTTQLFETDDAWLHPEDQRFEPITVSRKWLEEKHVQAPGYYVMYEDGYTSWSPVEAFEKGYTLTPGPIVERLRPSKAAYDLEQALIDVANATDGAGLLVRLLPSSHYDSESLRRATTDFMKIDFDHAEFFGRDSSEKKSAMSAWYRNLALLAKATSLAIAKDDV